MSAQLPAFPIPLNSGESWNGHTPCDGLTKRELFAAMAMQGLAANPGGPWQANHQNGWALCNCTLSEAMHIAVETADALLAALETKPEVSGD